MIFFTGDMHFSQTQLILIWKIRNILLKMGSNCNFGETFLSWDRNILKDMDSCTLLNTLNRKPRERFMWTPPGMCLLFPGICGYFYI